MNETTWPENPALRALAPLIGAWRVQLFFPTDPPGTVSGVATFEWLEGGRFFVMRTGNPDEGSPSSVCVIGRDDAGEDFTSLYFDDRGVSRIYHMSFDGGEWKRWRGAPGFAQRFTGTVSDDGNTITAEWQRSADGVDWEHDFDLVYTRAG
jgi:hypothetical protein